jgi:hypothetical protein
MKKYNLYNFYKRRARTEDEKKVLDYLEYSISKSIYAYGDHFKNKKSGLFSFFLNKIKIFIIIIAAGVLTTSNKKNKKMKGLSMSAFRYDELLSNQDISIERIFWAPKKSRKITFNFKLYIMYLFVDFNLHFNKGNNLISNKKIKMIISFRSNLLTFLSEKKYKFLFVSEDMSFYSRLLIDVFKDLKKPSFLLAHGGVHSFYGNGMDERTNFVGQWGQMQINGFVNNNYDESRFVNIGHPFYSKNFTNLSFSFENILILTKTVSGVSLEEDKNSEDRGNAITYLLLVKEALLFLGVKKARLRPHPSESIDWYIEFLGNDFYIEDSDSVEESLLKSSLVIGPISTMIVDSVSHGVNYVLFEPVIDGKNILGSSLMSFIEPLGNEFPWAKSKRELIDLLVKQKKISSNIFQDLCKKPFDSRSIHEILSHYKD